MSLFRRIALTVSASVDRLVGEIENHDATVEAAIRDSRRLYARASVRHTRMREEGERLRRKLSALQSDTAAWRERALTCEASSAGEEQALECLRRSKRAAAQAEALERTLERHLEVERRLGEEIAAMRQGVESLEHRRELLRSREATADAATRIRETELKAGSRASLDEVFERWETRVTEAEVFTETTPATDPFESRFVAEEERAALRAELGALQRRRAARPDAE